MAARISVLEAPDTRTAFQPQANPPEITLRAVRKDFGPTPVLRGIDLAIAPGEFVALVGKSGCGKSTLLRLVAGLDKPSEGVIQIEDKPLLGLNKDARMMFQDARLLPWKRVLDNVGLGLTGRWQPQAEQALAEVGLQDRAHDWPAILSGGQRQRVALARALVRRPHLLLLDEPLGALDALTRIEMQRLIERVWHEYRFTVLLITHDVEEAIVLADRVVLIEEGRIVLDLRVPLDRPRQRGSAEFAALKDRLLERVLGQETPFASRLPATAGYPSADDGPAPAAHRSPVPCLAAGSASHGVPAS